MASLATLTRARVKEVVEAEFSDRSWTVADDKLLRAAGHKGSDEIAVFPEAEREKPGAVNQLECPVWLQVYLAYDANLDEDQVVDPTIIEEIAERLRAAFADESGGDSADLWFLRLQRIEYPDDPTGNKSRLEALITGYGANQAATLG